MTRVLRRLRSLAPAVLVALTLLALPTRAQAAVELVPSSDGYFGALLLAGPLTAGEAKKLDTSELEPKNGAAPTGSAARFKLVSVPDGAFDVAKILGLGKQAGPYAVMGGTLVLVEPLEGFILIGADGGVKASVDGKVVWSRDVPRLRDRSWDAVPVSLSAGRHQLVLLLHDLGEYWALALRVLERSTLLPPKRAVLELAGTSASDSEVLARSMIDFRFATGLEPSGYRPRVAVEYRRGVPRVPLSARVTLGIDGRPPAVSALGAVPIGERGITRFEARLAPIETPALGQGTTKVKAELVVGPVTLHQTLYLTGSAPSSLTSAGELRHDMALAKMPSLLDASVIDSTLEWQSARLADVGADPNANAASVERVENELGELVRRVRAGDDPMQKPGITALAMRSDFDGRPQQVLVHVPAGFRGGQATRYPLVVVLHGYDGDPKSVFEAFFGSASDTPKVDGFVVAPHAYGNGFYRGAAEHEVLRVIDWMLDKYPIDPLRVAITGVSMGGTGTAQLALRHADRFAAAAPLCGYQSFFVRRDVAGKSIKSWERERMQHWSPASFAENGRNLPLYVAHGLKDFPLENSRVLIDRYKALGYRLVEQWPDIGHDVWRVAWKGGRMFTWLSGFRRDPEPAEVTLKTDELYDAHQAWVRVTALERSEEAAEIDARVTAVDRITVTTKRVRGFALERPAGRLSSGAGLTVEVDGDRVVFDAAERVTLVRNAGGWHKGSPPADPRLKRAGLEGPIRDAWQGPLAFVYGTLDPTLTRANREVADFFAHQRWAMDLSQPVIADREVDERLERERSLVLVGNEKSNLKIAEIAQALPIRTDGDSIRVAGSQYRGHGIGAIFVHPNPRAPERYVVVVLGVDAAGVYRALSLPQLLPDFLVYDERLAAAAGQQILGSAEVLSGGFFDERWQPPISL